MKLLKKSEVVVSKEPFRVRCTSTDYLKDYPVITKQDNPDVIRIYIQMEREKGMVLRYKYLPNEHVDVYKYYKKRKQVALHSRGYS